MPELSSKQKTEIAIKMIKKINDLDLNNLANAIENEKRSREKSSGNNGSFTSTESL